MSTVYASYSGEEIEINFSANAVHDWQGHPDVIAGVHNITIIEDIEIDDLSILGVEVKVETLPERLQAALLELADGLEFEGED